MQRHSLTQSGTRGTEGYQHIESVVPKTDHVVPVEYKGAERLTGKHSAVPRVPRVPRSTNTWSQWYQRLNMWYQQSTGVQRDSLAQRAWYQGYRGVPTHKVNGTKDSTCGTSRVLGCRETHWHRELGTRGTEGYQHIE